MTDFNKGFCRFIGDWKQLKYMGFKYVRHNGIFYFFEGSNKEFKYSGTVIRKAGGYVGTGHESSYLLHVFNYLDTFQELPDEIFVNEKEGSFYLESDYPYTERILIKEKGFDVLYKMFKEGMIEHNPDLSLELNEEN